MYEVFIAEDEPPIADMIAEMVNDAPGNFHAARIAHDGQTMLGILTRQKPDLLLVDIRMPVMDGLELIRKSRTLYPDLVCIVLTSYAEFDYARTALQFGVLDYILKTRLPESLHEILGKTQVQLEQAAGTREREYLDRLMLTKDTGVSQEPDLAPLHYAHYQVILVPTGSVKEQIPAPFSTMSFGVKHDFGRVGAGLSLVLFCIEKDKQPDRDEPGVLYGEPFDHIGDFPRMVENLLNRLEDETSGEKGNPSDSRQAALKLREYLDLHVEEAFDIKGKYILHGYNSLYLARIFNACFGISPKRYHTRAKIELVKTMLQANPSLLLKEAAIRVNFGDELYLAKVFKQETGLTYSEYRKRFCANT